MIQLNALPGQTLDGKYRIDKLLGRGGMGAVYLAQHLGTRRYVALKVIVPSKAGSTEYLERFRREAESAGMLRHPNVVDVTDFGATEVGGSNIAYLVMEYLDGCDLQLILAEEKRLPVSWAVDIMSQACSAVGEAHKRGIIHRDLKPANIWLEPDRMGGYNVKVLDFGLARVDSPNRTSQPLPAPAAPNEPSPAAPGDTGELPTVLSAPKVGGDAGTLNLVTVDGQQRQHEGPTLVQRAVESSQGTDLESETELMQPVPTSDHSSSLTRVGSIMGSPGYMSPEQCRGETVDFRSDIYSLGVIAYEMLTGAKTIAGGDLNDIIRQTVEDEPLEMQTLRPDLPDALCNVVMKALSKNPDDRPQSAAVFGSTVRASAQGVGALLKTGIIEFTNNIGIFLKIFLMAFVPFFAIRLLLNRFGARQSGGGGEILVFAVMLLVGIVGSFVSAALARGLSAVVYSMSIAMPTAVINVRGLFSRLRSTARNLVRASFVYFARVTVPMAVFGGGIIFAILYAPRLASDGGILGLTSLRVMSLAIAALAMFLLLKSLPRFSMLPIVVLVEEDPYADSLVRSSVLGHVEPKLIRWLGIVEAVIFLGLQLVRFLTLELLVYLPTEKFGHALVSNVESVGLLALVLLMGFELTVGPMLALVYAALYLKLRLASGETMEAVISDQFVLPDVPRTKWQKRMIQRLSSQA